MADSKSPHMPPLTTGNAAKAYCLNWIAQRLDSIIGEASILDLGCGNALGFIPLLRRYPQVHYVGIEPREESYEQALHNLRGLNGTAIRQDGYGVYEWLGEKFDFVVSFSTLEHVYRREAYLRSARDCMMENGHILTNYDTGHFMMGTRRDRVKNVVGPILARFGIERYYQSLVHEQEFLDIVHRLNLEIVDSKFFNTCLKGINHVVPPNAREAFIERWLDLELWLNTLGVTHTDSLAASFFTRNFILRRAQKQTDEN